MQVYPMPEYPEEEIIGQFSMRQLKFGHPFEIMREMVDPEDTDGKDVLFHPEEDGRIVYITTRRLPQ